MSNVDITDSDNLRINQYNDDGNEVGEIYEEKGYSKIPLDQINLETEPISITNDSSYSLFDTNIKSYIKVFLGFIVFIIILFIISILSGHFHYEKIEMNENEGLNNQNFNKINQKQEVDLSKTLIQLSNNQTENPNITINITNNNNTFSDNAKILK